MTRRVDVVKMELAESNQGAKLNRKHQVQTREWINRGKHKQFRSWWDEDDSVPSEVRDPKDGPTGAPQEGLGS